MAISFCSRETGGDEFIFQGYHLLAKLFVKPSRSPTKKIVFDLRHSSVQTADGISGPEISSLWTRSQGKPRRAVSKKGKRPQFSASGYDTTLWRMSRFYVSFSGTYRFAMILTCKFLSSHELRSLWSNGNPSSALGAITFCRTNRLK